MVESLTIRRGARADRELLAAHNRAMAEETEGKRLDERASLAGVDGLFADEARGFYLVAARAGRIVGQLMVTREWSDWRNADFWWIQSVYVPPAERRRGVFSALFRALEAEARASRTVCGLRLYAERGNERAHSTYRALGMRETHYRIFELDWSGRVEPGARAPDPVMDD